MQSRLTARTARAGAARCRGSAQCGLLGSLLLGGALSACGALPGSTESTVQGALLGSVAGPGAPETDLCVVAHQDDELLFINPVILRSIQRRHAVRCVFLTAGNAGIGAAYWTARQKGILEAYAWAAGAENRWSSDTLDAAGRKLTVYSLLGPLPMSLIFLHLPDGDASGDGFASTRHHSLKKLWMHLLPAIRPVDGGPAYTRQDLIDILADIMIATFSPLRPGHLHLLDCTQGYPREHSDHHFSALFGLAAQHKHFPSVDVELHVGLGAAQRPKNLAPAVADRKWAMFLRYARHDTRICADGSLDCVEHIVYRRLADRAYVIPRGSNVWVPGPAGCTLQATPLGP